MTIEKNNWNRWKKTAGSFDMEEIQMALRNYNTREENEMQAFYSDRTSGEYATI